MKALKSAWKQRSHIVGALGLGACMALGAQPVHSQDKPAAKPREPAGLKVYIDPTTGAFLPGPAPGAEVLQVPPSEAAAMSRSSVGLVETPNSGPAGGVKLNTQGRFLSPLIATMGPDGKVTQKHISEKAGTPVEPQD